MRVVGLTGSIGMGKSTTAALFRSRGVPVHDADAAVHRLYQGRAAEALCAAFPAACEGGAVDRKRMAQAVISDPAALARLEAILHPLVREEETAFLASTRAAGSSLCVLDVPLLFETGGLARVDVVLVVSADPATQRARVLARPGMTAQKFEALQARQWPDAEKRRRAHFVLDTGRGLEAAARGVDAILRALATMR